MANMMQTFCSLAAACLAASLLPPADMTLPAFCLGAGAAPLLDEGRPGAAAAPLPLLAPEAAHKQEFPSQVKQRVPVCHAMRAEFVTAGPSQQGCLW